MDRTEQEKNTFDHYNKDAKGFAAFRGEGVNQYWSAELAHFQQLLPTGTVLEVGCGIGNEAIILEEMGYDYIGTDISTGMLSIARSRVPEGNFVCQDFRIPILSSKFDGLLAFASLLHLEKNEMAPTLITLRQQLRSGGIGLLTLKEGTGSTIDDKGRFFTYYSPDELAKHILDSGFDLIDQTIHEEKGHNFICCFVQNP